MKKILCWCRWLLCVLVLVFVSMVQAARIHVDANVVGGGGTGVNWPNAVTTLQTGLSLAVNTADEIWVADSTTPYLPTAEYPSAGARNATFRIQRSNLQVYGGFRGNSRPGGGETTLDQRDPIAYPTVLSGDIGTVSVAGDNAHHVVYFDGTADDTTILDGFFIEDGYNDNVTDIRGGGAGIRIENVSPRIVNCTVRDCFSNGSGGGIHAWSGGVPIRFINCTVINNTVDGSTARRGGGVFSRGTVEYVNCVVAGNVADDDGGGIAHYGINAGFGGAWVFATGGPILLSSCTIAENDAGNVGGGVSGSVASVGDSVVHNCILWGNDDSQTGDPLPETQQLDINDSIVKYTCMENIDGYLEGEDGETNTWADPSFVGSGDYHLQIGSPVADIGSVNLLPIDVGDLDTDSNTSERLPRDRSRKPRIAKGSTAAQELLCTTSRLDMGAFELFDCDGDDASHDGGYAPHSGHTLPPPPPDAADPRKS